jgi:flagellar FliL protein
MAEAGQTEARDDAPAENAPTPRRKGRRALMIAATGLLIVVGSAGAAYQFVPQVSETVHRLAGGKALPEPAISAGPVFVDLPEMAVTLPNGGRARQMRIRLSIELAKKSTDLPPMEILSPRVYDALLTYLRTLRDGELDGGLAIDRLRSDLYRRLTVVLGPGVVADVLITGLVVA